MKEKGITLIALVVTVIILLILAGVTLSMTLNEGGIFSKAKKAADNYKIAQNNETDMVNSINQELDKYGNGGGSTGGKKAEENKSYVGYYADLDGDPKTAEGIIYADLAVGSGRRKILE